MTTITTSIHPVSVIEGNGPVILAQPHSGTFVPYDIYAELNDRGRQLLDTDWHIPELYDGLLNGVSIVRANFSRYVIDPNRDPHGSHLYPGKNTTDLVPLSTFDGKPIWNKEPTIEAIEQRVRAYHLAYHDALQAQICRVKAVHGVVVLYYCHSIRSQIPYLFDDVLPELNIGTNSGLSCDSDMIAAAEKACLQSGQYSYVVDGRFKGGWTTRHYGQPSDGIHAIQMELAQRTYLHQERPPFDYDQDKANTLREVLTDILWRIKNIAETHFSRSNDNE